VDAQMRQVSSSFAAALTNVDMRHSFIPTIVR
jgi:hypothetical protein